MPYTTQEMEVKYFPVDMQGGKDFERVRILDFEVLKPTSVQEYGSSAAVGWSQQQIDDLINERGEVFDFPNARAPIGGDQYSEGAINTPMGVIEGLPSFPLIRVSNNGALLWAWTPNLEEIPAAERIMGGEGVDTGRRA